VPRVTLVWRQRLFAMALHKDLVEKNFVISFAADVVEPKSMRIRRVLTGFPLPHPEDDAEDEHVDSEHEQDDGRVVNFVCDGRLPAARIKRVPTGFLYPQDLEMRTVGFDKDAVEHRRCQIRRVPTGYLYPTAEATAAVSFASETVERTCSRIRRVPTGYLYPREESKTVVSFAHETVDRTCGRIRRVPTGYLYPAEESKTAVSFDNETVDRTCGRIRRVPTGYLYSTDKAKAVSFDNDTVEHSCGKIRRVPTGFLSGEHDEIKQELENLATFVGCNRALWRLSLPPTTDDSDEHALPVARPISFLCDMGMEVKSKSVTFNQVLWREAFPPSRLPEVSNE